MLKKSSSILAGAKFYLPYAVVYQLDAMKKTKTVKEATNLTLSLIQSNDMMGQSAVEFSDNKNDRKLVMDTNEEIVKCILKLAAEDKQVIFLTENNILAVNLSNSLMERSLTVKILKRI